MANTLSRAERCHTLAEQCRRVSATLSSIEMRNHLRRMSNHYSSLAAAEELGRLAYRH
jgi:hypothetical protein